jgi:hypothetical protein
MQRARLFKAKCGPGTASCFGHSDKDPRCHDARRPSQAAGSFPADLQIDEAGQVEFCHFRVDENGSTYIDKGARLQCERNYFTVVVTRRTDGINAHLISKWTTFRSGTITNYKDLIPIIDIVEDTD